MKTTTILIGALLLAGAPGAVADASAAAPLTAKNGMTVYVFDEDVGGKPSCYFLCALRWPAYMARSGEKTKSGWSMVKRRNGSLQWAYRGKPLYFYAGDKKAGDTTGDGLGGVWHIVGR